MMNKFAKEKNDAKSEKKERLQKKQETEKNVDVKDFITSEKNDDSKIIPISEVQMLKNGVKRKCKPGEWLRRGKCAGMVGIAVNFSELPNEVVSTVRESLIENFWSSKKGEPKRAKLLLAKIEQKLKHGLAFHSERQVQGKPTCLLIKDSDETAEQIRVLDIIMTEDWKSGRAIDGEFKEIHLMHYYEHYLENFSTLLFNGQTIHRIG
jgi:hypothetical protein